MANERRPVGAPALAFALWLAAAAAASAAEPDPFNGRLLFEQCKTCHAVKGRGGNKGPPLDGLFGRRAANVPGFAYSAAMKALDVVWDEETLHAFLRKPADFVPGTTMTFGGLPREQDRIDLIANLRRVLAE